MERFMEPQIVAQTWLVIDGANGTQFLPDDLFDSDQIQEIISGSNGDDLDYISAVFELISDYCNEVSADRIQSIGMQNGFGARLSAPGYMDATDWTVFDTEREAVDYLKEELEGEIDDRDVIQDFLDACCAGGDPVEGEFKTWIIDGKETDVEPKPDDFAVDLNDAFEYEIEHKPTARRWIMEGEIGMEPTFEEDERTPIERMIDKRDCGAELDPDLEIVADCELNGHELRDVVCINPGCWFGKTWLLEIGGSYTPFFVVVEADSASDAIDELIDDDKYGKQLHIDDVSKADYGYHSHPGDSIGGIDIETECWVDLNGAIVPMDDPRAKYLQEPYWGGNCGIPCDLDHLAIHGAEGQEVPFPVRYKLRHKPESK